MFEQLMCKALRRSDTNITTVFDIGIKKGVTWGMRLHSSLGFITCAWLATYIFCVTYHKHISARNLKMPSPILYQPAAKTTDHDT